MPSPNVRPPRATRRIATAASRWAFAALFTFAPDVSSAQSTGSHPVLVDIDRPPVPSPHGPLSGPVFPQYAPLFVFASILAFTAGTAVVLAAGRRRRLRVRPPGLADVLDVAGERHVLSAIDGERVDMASDYVAVVDELLTITDGALPELICTCVERRECRKLTLRIGRRTFTTELRGDTASIDFDPLLDTLNKVLASVSAPGRLYEFDDGRRDQTTGIVYATDEQAALLRKKGLLTKPFFVNAEDVAEPRCKPGTRVRFHPNAQLASAILAEEYVVRGLRCARGTELCFNPRGGLSRAVLARAHSFDKIAFPAGSAVEFYEGDDLDPPASAVTIALPCRIADLDLPEGSRVEFDDHGRIMGAVVGRDIFVGHTPCPEGTFIGYESGAWKLRKAAPYRG